MSEIKRELEDILMYGYEEVLYRYFKVFQNPDRYRLNKIKNFKQYYFMSERFYKIYQILIQKYPELRLQKDIYQQGESLPRKSTLYINDVVSDLPSKIGFNDKMLFTTLSSLEGIQEDFYINCGKKTIESPWVSNFEELTAMEKDTTISNRMKRKSAAIFLRRDRIRQSLDSMGLELQFLKNNGVFNAYDLAPICARKYFKIIFENSEQIRYFLNSFYSLYVERDVSSDEELTLIQKEALEQTKNYFKENLNVDVLTFFSTISPHYYDFSHYPLSYNMDDIDNRLSLLSGGVYDELSSKDFSYKRLSKGYQLK